MSLRKNSGNSYPPIEVHVTRGNLTESVHFVDAFVADSDGQKVASFGLGETAVTYPRSSIKMLQALCFVESGAFHAFALTDRHLALACASHNGEAPHTNLILNWLQAVGLQEDDMVCGPHFPYDEKTSRELIRKGEGPCRRHNNCSGKHSGFLTTMKHLDWNPQHYNSYDHPLQKKLRQILTELSGDQLDLAAWGIDGCGIPTYAMSLSGLARGLRNILPDQHLPAERREAFRLIREAVLSQPYFIGGSGDFCSELMQISQGQVVIKSGAEGVCAGALLHQGLSFGLKVRDGNARAVRVAAAALLKGFKGMTEHEFLQLSSHTQPAVKSWDGLTVGKIFVPHPVLS